MKRRVAVITEIIAPYRVPVFNALAKVPGIDLHVIFLAETDPTLREWHVPKDDIQFRSCVLPGWRRRFAGCNVLLNWGVRRQLQTIHPDLLICGGYNYLASWQAAFWCTQNHVPLVLWSESTEHDHRRQWPVVELLKSKFLQACDACVTPGQSALEYLAKLQVPRKKLFIAPDAVDNDYFARQAAIARSHEREYRRKRNLPQHFFLFAGRLTPAKGVFDLLDAYTGLSPEIRSEFGLIFAGNGSAKPELERKARSVSPGCIQLPGFLQKEELSVYYALADAFVFPTHSDPWGLVVNEAMSCGLPIIATSVAGCTADLVANGWNGIVVPPGDVRRLSLAMETLANSAQLRSEFGARSARIVSQNTPDACAQGLARAALITTELANGY